MDVNPLNYRRFLEGVSAEKQKSVELETPHSFIRALLSFVFTLLCFSFLSRSYSVNLEIHSVHSHAVVET